jgi:hypothetical protein
MILQAFKKIVLFKVHGDLIDEVEKLIIKWHSILRDQPLLIAGNYPLKILPLTSSKTYAFNASWSEGFGVALINWAHKNDSIWIYVENDIDVKMLDAFITIQYYSTIQRMTNEEESRIKSEMENGAYKAVAPN